MTRADVLKTAVRCAIRNGCDRKLINVPAWASSYGVTMKAVRDAWEAELTKAAPSFEAGSEK
jgi:hypothetical protein